MHCVKFQGARAQFAHVPTIFYIKHMVFRNHSPASVQIAHERLEILRNACRFIAQGVLHNIRLPLTLLKQSTKHE
jgi:hypothetical protein